MRVCDICRNVHAPCAEYKVAMSRPSETGTARHAKVKESVVELCDGCSDKFWSALESASAQIRGLTPPATVTDDKPVAKAG